MNHKKTKKESRDLGVIAIAGSIAVLSALIAMATFSNNPTSVIVSAVFAILALMALAVAIYGKKKTLKEFLEALFYFPF